MTVEERLDAHDEWLLNLSCRLAATEHFASQILLYLCTVMTPDELRVLAGDIANPYQFRSFAGEPQDEPVKRRAAELSSAHLDTLVKRLERLAQAMDRET